jgi:hypothetical protein
MINLPYKNKELAHNWKVEYCEKHGLNPNIKEDWARATFAYVTHVQQLKQKENQ